MKAFAVGFISYSNEMYPEPNGKNKTWAIFVNESNAIEWSKQHGGKLKIRPVDVSLKFTRPTSMGKKRGKNDNNTVCKCFGNKLWTRR